MPACAACGAPAAEDDRAGLDAFLRTASEIQHFQVANRLGVAGDDLPGAVICQDCAAAAAQWANVE